METSADNWYIVKQDSEQCEILSEQEFAALTEEPAEQWGPFKAQNQAIAKRVGLIRSGKCEPS